ncbi:J domain-containing protein [Zavarzinella formosa]|uniref:J domain-containing protein n=1 Tax=Zavarzinella formosa TaxID=360055 RepID=UPI0002DFB4EB|nr:J domain-containing protein [Zavarzinella formosa]
MTGPYDILGVKFEDTDEIIRSRYLELVRQFPPEHHAEKFNAIRAAYDMVKTLQNRIDHRLFSEGRTDTVDDVMKEVFSRLPRQRYSLAKLAEAHQKANQ